MKRILTLTTLLILLLPVWAMAADYTVTQTGAGADYSVAQFNALTGTGYAGDTFYFSGTITSTIQIEGLSGTPGNYITLDGWSGGDCDPVKNRSCPGAAVVSRPRVKTSGIEYNGINLINCSYIAVQDFEITNGWAGIFFIGGLTARATHVTVRRNYIHNTYGVGIQQTRNAATSTGMGVNYVTIGGALGDGNLVYDTSEYAEDPATTLNTHNLGVHRTNDCIISYNEIGNPAGDQDLTDKCNVISVNTSERVLIEYNKIYNPHGEAGVVFKEGGGNDKICRFNEVYGAALNGGISVICGGGTIARVYIYGNWVHDSGEGTQLYRNYDDVYIWANIYSDMVRRGVDCSYESGTSQGDVYVYNNTFVRCGETGEPQPGALRMYGSYPLNVRIKNNIFDNNDDTHYGQVFVFAGLEKYLTAMSYNIFNYTGRTPTAYYNSGYRDVDYLNSIGKFSNNTDQDPGFVDSRGDNFRLQSTSPARNTGADLSGLAGSVTVQGVVYNMYWDDCLDPNNTDWSTSPPTVATKKQDDYVSWEKGAYIYTGGGPGPAPNETPTAIITTPASNVTVNDEDTQALAGSYTDPDGDTCTYVWVIPTNTFKVWEVGTTYAANDLVEDNGVAGAYYKSIAGGNIGNDPPSAEWNNALTQASPGTGTCDTPGTYAVSLKVNDGTVDSPTVTRSITVLDAGSPTTTKEFSRNTAGDVATGDASYIYQNYTDGNYADLAYIRVNKSALYTRKTVVLFDLTSLAAEEITDGTLSLYLEIAPGVTTNIELYSCADAFVEGDGTANSDVTWNCADDGGASCDVAWTGTHGQTTLLKAVQFTTSSTLNQYYEWESSELTSYLQSRAGSIAYFILIGSVTDGGYASFSSDEDTDGQRPKLSVTYGSEAGVAPVLVSIECPNCDGSKKAGDTIGPFILTFNKSVEYDQTVVLTLDSEQGAGANDATSTVNAGSGTTQLNAPAFTVTTDHVTTDLDALKCEVTAGYLRAVDDETSIALTGTAFTIFPTGAESGSLASNNNIIIDVTAPATSAVMGYDATHCTTCTADGTVSTAGTQVRFAIQTDTLGLIINAKPGYPRIATNPQIQGGGTVYASVLGLGDTTDTIIMAIEATAGMRVLDLNFSGDLDLGPGGTITDTAGNPVAISMGALSLADVAAIVLGVPYPTGTPKEFSSSSTITTYLAAGGYFIANDFIECTEANSIGTADMSGSDGTSGNVITIDGGGFSHAGTRTYGDYYVIKNCILE